MRSLWTAATGMAAQQTNMDVIANNLANANTTGFKASRGNFEDLMYQTTVPAGAQNSAGTTVPTGIQIGMGTKTSSVEKLFSQGTFTQTDNPLDMAIQGNGFFQVLRGTQQVYTRAGSFKTDQNGNVVDASGYPLQPQITIPKTAVATQCRSFRCLHGHRRYRKGGSDDQHSTLQLSKPVRAPVRRGKLFHPDPCFR